MSPETTIDNDTGAPVVSAAALEGVRTSRVISFFIDYLIIGVLCIPFAVIIGLLGILTLGLAWGLYAFLPAIVALLYLAFTMGGPQSGNGRHAHDGRSNSAPGRQESRPFARLPPRHSVLGHPPNDRMAAHSRQFLSSKKRLLQDILLGTYVVRA